MVIGTTSVLLFAAMMLWAVITRNGDPLVSVEEYRESIDKPEINNAIINKGEH